MPSNSYPIIAREGWLLLVLVAAIALLMKLYSLTAGLVLLGLFTGLLILFRDPMRPVPSGQVTRTFARVLLPMPIGGSPLARLSSMELRVS